MNSSEVQVSYSGNGTIDPLIANIQQLWRKGEADRLALGQYFAQLKKATQRYKEDEETGLTYTSAVKRTGVPRSTAEYYRVMWETVSGNGIPAQVFLLLREAGFNLATDLREEATVQGILQDHPELLSGEIPDYDSLAKTLKREYAKKEDDQETIADLQEFMDTSQGAIPRSVLNKAKEKIHALRMRALTNLCLAVAPFLNKDREWAQDRTKKYADNHEMTRQRYDEAVRFAQSLIQE
jgi:hypothetical protein